MKGRDIMKCPKCKNVDLLLVDRNDVEIDYCPNCHGVWLDKGELDKVIKKEEQYDYEPKRKICLSAKKSWAVKPNGWFAC